jgi:ribosome-associated translation inhibitor RaiA
VYVKRENKIYCINSDIFYNPFIILHEFYHHIRTKGGIHRGSEKHANMYAKSFIESYKKIIDQITRQKQQ